jgi:hypothetical protein
MITLTEKEFNQLNNIVDGYSNRLYELESGTEEYNDLKLQLDNEFCELRIFGEKQIIHAELNLGNVMIKDDILTCIYDNEIHRFNMVNRKASNNEYAYIIQADDCDPFHTKYIGRCFKVSKQPSKEALEWCVEHVCINEEGLDVGWNLYDSQYVVLEEI